MNLSTMLPPISYLTKLEGAVYNPSSPPSTHLKGRKPPTAKCAQCERYQGTAGISRAMFLVRQGKLNSMCEFLPKMPPNTVKG